MVISRHTSNSTTLGLPSVYVAHFADAVMAELDQADDMLQAWALRLARCGPDQRIPVDAVMSLLRHIDAQARPGWHIEAALALEAAHHGPVGVAIASAPTIGQALDVLSRYESLRFPFAALSCTSEHGRWSLRVLPLIEPEGPWELLLEIHLLSLAGLLERVLARHRAKLNIILPPGYRAWRPALEARYGARLRFSGRHYRLELPMELLAEIGWLADRAMHRDAVARCRQLLTQQSDGNALSTELRARLLSSSGQLPTLEEAARDWCCSSRTLIRRLNKAGTSYRTLVDDARKLLAFDLLRRSELELGEIAERLGYRDVANFGRACRRWYGRSPGRMRQGSD